MPKSKKNRAAPAAPAETQAAEAATIGWMLAVLTATVSELGVLTARLIYSWRPEATGIATAGELLLFAAAIVGLIAIGLIPVVYKLRRLKPPASVTAFAIVVGIAPWMIISAQLLTPLIQRLLQMLS